MENIFNSTEETNSTSIQPTLDPALLAQLRSGANWFYWIAGLSVVNSLIFAFGGKVSFIAGLGLTQIVDGIFDAIVTAGAPSAVRAVAIVISFVVIDVCPLRLLREQGNYLGIYSGHRDLRSRRPPASCPRGVLCCRFPRLCSDLHHQRLHRLPCGEAV